jgi:hypothetical protein
MIAQLSPYPDIGAADRSSRIQDGKRILRRGSPKDISVHAAETADTIFLYAINGLHDVYLFSNTYYVKMVKFI